MAGSGRDRDVPDTGLARRHGAIKGGEVSPGDFMHAGQRNV